MPATAGPPIRIHAGVAIAAAALAYATVSSMLFVYAGAPRHRSETAWFITAAAVLVFLTATSSGKARSSGAPWPSLRNTLMTAGVFLSASFALYSPVLDSGLLSDDFVLVRRAMSGQLTLGTEFFRPLPMLIWWAAGHVAPDDALAFHAINAAAHGTNCWLVCCIAIELGLARGWSILAGALCLVSPSSVESVTWISGLFDVLMVTGTLAYVLACLQGRHVIAIGALAVALLSKETGVTAALLGMLVAMACRRSLRVPLSGLALTVVFTSVRILLLPPPEEYLAAPSGYLLKELISRSFGALALPWTTSDLAVYPALALFPWLPLVCLIAIAMWFRLSWSGVSNVFVLVGWVIMSVLPVFRYFYIAPTLEGSRYLYLGTVAFSILLVQLASTAPARLPRVIAVALVVGVLAGGTFGLLLHQQPWISAATQRESVLLAARNTLATAGCATISISRLPDSHEGAYIFRNGFKEALERYDIATPPLLGSDADCAYEWTGRDFVKQTR
jgi:hypothetical protein